MLIEIDEDELLEALIGRVRFWTDDDEIVGMFADMYENEIDAGYFNGARCNIKEIVDNDYVNWCRVVYESEDDFQKFNEMDVWDEDENGSTVMAKREGLVLVRC